MSEPILKTDSLDLAKLREDLIRDEGVKDELYFDDEGYVTYGIGRNIMGNPFTEEERKFGKQVGFKTRRFIDFLFEKDIAQVTRDLDARFPWWRVCSGPCQRGLANMRFQLGPSRFAKFAPTWEYLQRGDKETVGIRLRNTPWAREQTPLRAERVIRLIES